MGVTIHWLEGQIRQGPDHKQYGDDWTTIITIQRVGDTAHLSGGRGKLPREAQLEIMRSLYREGFRWVSWERSKRGKMLPRKYPIDPAAIGLEPDTSGMTCALFAVGATLAALGMGAWGLLA